MKTIKEINQKPESRIWGNSSLVTGILSLLFFLMPYFAIPLGVFAIISHSIQERKYGRTGNSVAGLITGIIGIVIGVILSLIVLLFVSMFSTL